MKQIAKHRWALLIVSLLWLAPAFAQEISVRGVVLDGTDFPVAGAGVLIEGTTIGAATDADGVFMIDAKPDDRLVISCIGFKTVTVDISGRSELTVTLQEDELFLNEVVVTALGISRESKSLSYAVQEIGGSDLELTKSANVMSSLAGKVAGVQINSGAAGIGGGSRVVMRGTKSISGNNNALYVVDGIPLSNVSSEQPSDQYSGAGQTGDAMSGINADDIESISVLNGSAAAARA